MTGLAQLTPLEQLRAGKTGRRIVQLMSGLTLYGFSMALFFRAGIGLPPWHVFHEGVFNHVGTSVGTITVITGFVLLLLWIPLKQWPGLGTIANAVMIGVSLDLSLPYIPQVTELWQQVLYVIAGVVLNGLATAAYIGSQYGPGPRDGLMTGIAQKTGLSLRLVRTGIELSVLTIGWLLGGTLGIGTLAYALGIGPAVQLFLPRVLVPLTTKTSRVPTSPALISKQPAPQELPN